MDSREKLRLIVEREVSQHVGRVRESVMDFVMLYIKKNDPQFFTQEAALLQNILGIVRNAIDSEHLNKLDTLMVKLNSAIDEFEETLDE